MSQLDKALQKVVELTTAMQQKAQAELWDELDDLQLQREQLLSGVFPINPEMATTDTEALLEALLHGNQQVEQLCRLGQHTLRKQLQSLNQNKKAVAAYQST